MKILVVSDLHYEFQWDYGTAMTERLANVGPDVIVVAGDLTTAAHLGPSLIGLCACFRHVVYVPGNHEYYQSSFPEVKKILASVSRAHANLHVLVNKSKTIRGVRFVGTPLWFSYKGETQSDYMLADFHQIEGYREWVGVENRKAIRFLGNNVRHGDVAVTHHAPSMRSTPDRYLGSPLNRFFVCPVDGILEEREPKLWCHGHCLDKETEILSERGWLRYNDIRQGDVVYSYNPAEDVLERDVVRQVVRRPNYCGDVYEYRNRRIDLAVTSDHTMVGFNSSRSAFVEEPATTFFQRGTTSLVRSGILPAPGMGLPQRMLELYVAIAADGSLCNADLVRFRLWKKRKVAYLTGLLNFLGVPFRVKEYGSGAGVSVNFTLPRELLGLRIKGLDRKLLRCCPTDCAEILAAYRSTDGGINRGQTVIYTSKAVEKDLLQQVFTLNGYASSCTSRVHGFGKQVSHAIYVKQKQLHVIQRCYNKGSLTVRRAKHELFWCVSVKNRNFFMRRNGKIILVGNTHDSFDYHVGKTRVVCNPYGYFNVDTNSTFKSSLVVEV